jgi:hypothetical protein
MPRSTRRPLARRLAPLAPLTLVAALAGCAEHRASDLVGSMQLQFTGSNYTLSYGYDASSTKFRAQIVDDGSTCRLDLDVDGDGSGLHAWSSLTATESAPLLAGGSATVTASDRAPVVGGVKQQVIVNNATFVIEYGDTKYSTGGTIVVEPLPAPKGLLRVHLQSVAMHTFGADRDEILQGELELTYIGRNALDHTRSACPALATVPAGLVY